MVTMRDGTKLHTLIYAPREIKEPLPFLLVRTPYGIATRAERAMRTSYGDLIDDGDIFVFQDSRGRFKSEGTFVVMRPPRDPADAKAIARRPTPTTRSTGFSSMFANVSAAPTSGSAIAVLTSASVSVLTGSFGTDSYTGRGGRCSS